MGVARTRLVVVLRHLLCVGFGDRHDGDRSRAAPALTSPVTTEAHAVMEKKLVEWRERATQAERSLASVRERAEAGERALAEYRERAMAAEDSNSKLKSC